ncbi:hypothetical protein LJPFL01_3469 [Lelliottia jeotgali]|nr:hypothetical protein LJPFL01_3469 [Lelliottia jeotgali]
MTQPDIRIVTCSVNDALDWLNGVGSLTCLPAAESTHCRWYTLNDSLVVGHELLLNKKGPGVIILHQGGLATQPDKVWPQLQRHALQAAHDGEPLWLVLTGGLLSQREAAWQQHFSFVTPGTPPMGRLYAFGLLLSLFRGLPVRVPKLLLRLVGRKG